MKKLIFALFPFAFLFGEQNISTQTEILLRTIDYEPDIEYLEASSEGENGIVTSYTINGVEVDVSALDSVVDAIHERISKEAEFTQVQQKAIADYIGFLLETKGIKYENLGSKLVVKELSPENIAELTQNFIFIEGVEKREVKSDDYGWLLSSILEKTNIDPLGFEEYPKYWISNGDYSQNIDVGILMEERNGDCPDASLNVFFKDKLENYTSLKTSQHAGQVAYILQQASNHAYIYCEKQDNYLTSIKDKTPRIYILNQSYSVDNGTKYLEADRDLDNYIFNYQIASFKSGGNHRGSNKLKNVTSPGKAYNTTTVSFFHKYESQSNFSNIVYGDIVTQAQKPEIVAIGSYYFPRQLGLGPYHGSSYASPLIASGFGANLIAQYPIFRYQPQLLKAFLMTISQNITGEGSPVNKKEGAGTPNYEHTFKFMRTWWNGTVDYWFKDNKTVSKTKYLKQGHTYRIAISWLVHGNYTYAYNKPYLNFDLYIKKDGKVKAKSEREHDTFELIEFTPEVSGNYTFEIKKSFFDATNSKAKKNLYLGLAFTEIAQ